MRNQNLEQQKTDNEWFSNLKDGYKQQKSNVSPFAHSPTTKKHEKSVPSPVRLSYKKDNIESKQQVKALITTKDKNIEKIFNKEYMEELNNDNQITDNNITLRNSKNEKMQNQGTVQLLKQGDKSEKIKQDVQSIPKQQSQTKLQLQNNNIQSSPQPHKPREIINTENRSFIEQQNTNTTPKQLSKFLTIQNTQQNLQKTPLLYNNKQDIMPKFEEKKIRNPKQQYISQFTTEIKNNQEENIQEEQMKQDMFNSPQKIEKQNYFQSSQSPISRNADIKQKQYSTPIKTYTSTQQKNKNQSPQRIQNLINNGETLMNSKRQDNMQNYYTNQHTESSLSKQARPKDQHKDVNQDVINRLFINKNRQQQNQDSKRLAQQQKELEQTTDRPCISDKSRELALNNLRYQKPLYSADRYKSEMEILKLKQESFQQRKLLEEQEKEWQEFEEISKFLIHNPDKKYDQEEFLRKYQQQLIEWQAHKKGIKNQLPEDDQTLWFKPQINGKSRELARDLEKIEQRLGKLKESKKKKIETLLNEMKPTFAPTINKNSAKIASESVKYQRAWSPNVQTNSSTSPKQSQDNMNNRSLTPKTSKRIKYIRQTSITNSQQRDTSNNNRFSQTEQKPKHKFNKDLRETSQSRTIGKSPSMTRSQDWAKGYANDILKNNQLKKFKPANTYKSQMLSNKQKNELNGQNLHNFLQSYLKDQPQKEEDLDILNQYMKLKEEFQESLSSRNSKTNLKLSENKSIDEKDNKIQVYSKTQKADNKTQSGFPRHKFQPDNAQNNQQ